jgi:hypothetical protein
MKRLFRKKAALRAHSESAGFCQNSVTEFTKLSVKHHLMRSSGSEHAKSGSICGREWIGDPLESRTNALRSGQITAKTRFYQGKTQALTHHKRDPRHRETMPTVRHLTVKQSALATIGSEQAKSGSICGHERIGHLLESRTNALRSGQIAAKTRFYQGKAVRQNLSDAAQITVKHNGQTPTRSLAMHTTAKSGSILRLSSISVLANKGTEGTIGKNQTDFWRLSCIMTHGGPRFGYQMAIVRFMDGAT